MSAEPDTSRATGPRALALLLVLLLLVKGAFVVSLADVFFYGEELEKGTAAKAMLDGLGVAHHTLAYHAYEGGGFVISHLKALAFLVVGESILAHKLVAMLMCSLVLVAGFVLARRHFGVRAAALFGLLFVFGPESFQKLTLISLGIHFEATLFILIVLDRGLRLAFESRDAGAERTDRIVLGLAAGFGVFFSYQTVLACAWVFVWLAWRRRDVLLGRGVLSLAGAFALGILPLGLMAWQVGAAVFDIHGTGLTEPGAGEGRVTAFLRSLYVEREGLGRAGPIVYPVAALAAALAGLRLADRGARARCTWLAGFGAFWLAVYLSTGFVVGSVVHDFLLLRFAPLWIVATLVVAAVLGAGLGAARGSTRRRVALFASAGLVAFGAAASSRIVAAGRPAALGENVAVLAGTKGYDYAGYFAKFLGHLEGGEGERLRVLLDFDEPERSLLYADVAHEGFLRSDAELAQVLAELAALDADGVPDFALGLGPYLSRHAQRDLSRALALARSVPAPLGDRLAEAVGRFGVRHAHSPDSIAAEIRAHAAGAPDAAYLRGVGYRIYRRLVVGPAGQVTYVLKPAAARELIGAQPANVRADLLAGFDSAVRVHRLP